MKPPMTYLRRILWAVTLVYWISLFVATHLPPSRLPRAGVGDKFQHFAAYGLLTFMVGLTVWVAFPDRRWVSRLPLLLLVPVAAYAAFDELTQPLAGRIADINDWFADCGGALAAALVLYVLQRALGTRVSSRPASAAPVA